MVKPTLLPRIVLVPLKDYGIVIVERRGAGGTISGHTVCHVCVALVEEGATIRTLE
jgi:hypothetical protein